MWWRIYWQRNRLEFCIKYRSCSFMTLASKTSKLLQTYILQLIGFCLRSSRHISRSSKPPGGTAPCSSSHLGSRRLWAILQADVFCSLPLSFRSFWTPPALLKGTVSSPPAPAWRLYINREESGEGIHLGRVGSAWRSRRQGTRGVPSREMDGFRIRQHIEIREAKAVHRTSPKSLWSKNH